MFEKIQAWWWSRRSGLSTSFALFESMCLLFPIVVTVLAAVTLLVGGRIAAWQWWLPVGGMVGWCLWQRQMELSARLVAYGAFLVLLAGIWVIAGLQCTAIGVDNIVYHLPAMRLLVEGWNPIYAPTPELLAESMGIDPWETRLWHVLFTAKAVWYFNSAAYTFTGTPLNLFVPLFPFLLIVVAGQLWRFLRSYSLFTRLLAVGALWYLVPAVNIIVDTTVCLGGIGLLLAMARYLAGEKRVWMMIVGMSFWMMVAKLPGLLSCFVFWSYFVGVLLVRERMRVIPRVMGTGLLLVLLFGVTCASPYFTAWKHYGHPLYPAYSGDLEYPTYDITADFNMANEDALAMGAVGSFVNAYISPALAQSYYRWKLGRPTFAPNRRVWWQGAGGVTERPTAPLSSQARWLLLGAFAVLVIWGGRHHRFIWMAALMGIICIPLRYYGFLRYVPWCELVTILTLALISEAAVRRVRGRLWRWMLLGGVILSLGPILAKDVLRSAVSLDAFQTLNRILSEDPPPALYNCCYGGEIAELHVRGEHLSDDIMVATFGRPEKTAVLQARLLCKQHSALRRTQVYPLLCQDEARYPSLPGIDIRVSPEWEIRHRTELEVINANPNRKERLMAYPGFIAKQFLVTLPKLVWGRVKSLLRAGE